MTDLLTDLRCAREAKGLGERKRGSGSVMQASAHSCSGWVSRARTSRGSALPVVPIGDARVYEWVDGREDEWMCETRRGGRRIDSINQSTNESTAHSTPFPLN